VSSGGQRQFAADYNDVASRIVEFRQKYPTGSLQPADPLNPVKVVTVGDKVYLQYTACAYRTPDDERPGVGVAWEPFPGRTPFTRDSEAMVAETSAWGRALIAVGAADAKKGVASSDEVRNRRADHGEPSPTNRLIEPDTTLAADLDARVLLAADDRTLQDIWREMVAAHGDGRLSDGMRAQLRDAINARRAELVTV
jgi:hypothetical protein